jgi:hypothetical protein
MTGLLLSACGGTPPVKTYAIGVVNHVSVLEPVLEGCKARLAELGYVAGQNITSIYHGVLAAASEVIKPEVQSLLDQKVDLFLTRGTLPTLAAKLAVEPRNISVVCAPVINPSEILKAFLRAELYIVQQPPYHLLHLGSKQLKLLGLLMCPSRRVAGGHRQG